MTPKSTEPKARLFVIAAPSGAGKTTLVHRLMQRNPKLRFSISYTTRPKRNTETEGKDYFFVKRPEFEQLRARGELLESAEVFDNLYGTSRKQVDALLAGGHHVILEIDWQGARQVRAAMPECVSVFILPPSLEALVSRLESRGTDTPAVIARRLKDAKSDMTHWQEFDHVIINDRLEDAVRALEAVIEGRGAATETSDQSVKAAVARVLSG